jgi:GTPase SAR1 family protein
LGALLVYDITQSETFTNVNSWLKELQEHSSTDIVLSIVGNKSDLADQVQVTKKEEAWLAEQTGLPVVLTSAKTGEGVDEVLIDVGKRIYANYLLNKDKEGGGKDSSSNGLDVQQNTGLAGKCCN